MLEEEDIFEVILKPEKWKYSFSSSFKNYFCGFLSLETQKYICQKPKTVINEYHIIYIDFYIDM